MVVGCHSSDTTLAQAKPVVVYGGIVVDSLATLTLAEGLNLYFHGDAGITVYGTLKSLGSQSNPVVLRGDRLDHMFDYLPYDRVSGQWQGIKFTASSFDNILQHTDIHSTYNAIARFFGHNPPEALPKQLYGSQLSGLRHQQ